MLDWKYSDDGKRIILVDGEPRSKLKVTGTRLAGILGLNKWTTPFQMFCEITKVARPPFEDTIYTLAGKAIEPKQIEWTKEKISDLIASPEEFFGNRYNEVRFDFYPESKRFGGMWDSKLVRPSGKVSDIFEYKTTKRAEDWLDGAPTYYLLQALLYAHLEGAKRVHLVVSFLKDSDYNNPEEYVVDETNTQIYTYNIDTKVNGLNIEELVNEVNLWYDKHIVNGISPEFDEVKDKEYLKILRTNKPANDMDGDDLIVRANELINQINAIKEENKLAELEKELKACESGIKELLSSCMKDTDDKAIMGNYSLSRATKEVISFDEELMRKDGIYDRYAIVEQKTTITLRKTKEKN